jgi:hypothetical protein
MKKAYILLFLLFLIVSVKAGFDPSARGGRAAGLAYGSATSTDFWSVFNNQAAMSWDAKFGAGVFFENRYFVKEMSTRGIGLTLPASKNDAFGLSFSQYGYSAYNETKVGLSYSKSFANKVAAGLQFDYLKTASNNEGGSKGVFTFEFGIQSKINKKLMIGLYAFNPIHTILSDYNGYSEYVPVVLRFGLSYRFSDKFLLQVETEKDLHFDPIIRVGGEYQLNEKFFVRGGLSTGVVQYSIGFGTKWNGFSFDIASSYHQILGVTPLISLHYDFSNIFHKKSVPSLEPKV